LSVVKVITDAHAGNVQVLDGSDGQGITLVILIPLLVAAD
jgi:hypothetical protein